jgi:FkbM family methyltransferase
VEVTYTTVDTCQLAALVALLTAHIGYKENGVFVEVGAFDGKTWSNTYTLAALGWRGLYVEPNPEYAAQCRANHAAHPGVAVEQVAAGPYPGTARLYLGGSVSTISPDTVDVYRTVPTLSFTGLSRDRYIDVEVRRLDGLLTAHNIAPGFDLLVVDTEGTELDVLRGLDLAKWQPKMAIIEVHEDFPQPEMSWKAIPVGQYFARQGYQKVHHDTINTVWVRP